MTTPPTDELEQVWIEGLEAAYADFCQHSWSGTGKTDNPYSPETSQYRQWDHGYWTAWADIDSAMDYA